MESTESRYAHLLQPIRELTKNWEVDVASELNDYLEELDDMCITFDGGKIRLNFAEAALLIQGSACIYSKKVELLHSLVYQTLEYISDRNKKRSKDAAAAQEGDGDGAASGHDTDEAVFISLDCDVSENSEKTDCTTTAKVAPLPPESLIPPQAREKHRLPLISATGDVLCSQKDFRINLFVPGDEDQILLTLGSAASRFLLAGDLEPAANQQPGDEDDAADDGGEAAESFLPVEENHMDLDQDPKEHVDRHQAQSDVRALRERRQVDGARLRPEETQAAPPAVNVWTFNDPYAVCGEDRPLKPGKCYKVPDGLDDGGKRKRKRAACLQDFRSWFRGTFDPPEHKLKNGPTSAELNYIYLSTMKDKLRTRKRSYRKAGVMVSDEELRRTFLQPEEAEPVDGFQAPDLLGGGDDDSDNEHEVFPDELPAECVGAPDFTSPGAQTELSYEDLVTLRVEQLVVNCQGYTQETALSRRVKDWEDKIRPELEKQEQRTAFDIHDYGDRIVGSLNGIGQRRSFSSVVAGLDNFEACKYLLASLQLANDYTVEVDSVGHLEDSLDTMGLTLLSTDRATDRFKALTASA